MTVTYQQTDISVTGGGSLIHKIIAVGGAAGAASLSVTATSAGPGLQTWARFATEEPNDPGTNSWVGACTVRWNITTSNANLTWSELSWTMLCRGVLEPTVTATVGLAIGLGTTGVKTASVETAEVFDVTTVCTTASAVASFYIRGTSGSTMSGIFVWRSTSTITAPFTAGSGAPAVVTSMGTLAQLGAGS